MWWKQNKWKVIVPIAVVAILAAAFWYGGGAPGFQGWTVEENPASAASGPSAAPKSSPSAAPSGTPDITAPDTAPSQEAGPEESLPEEGPDAGAEPEPSPEPDGVPAGDEDDPEGPGMVIDPSTGQDPYHAGPVAEGNPLPVDPQDVEISDTAYTCTISISCAAILEHMDWLDPEKVDLVPEDGWILEPVSVTFYEGESVFHVLQRTCRQQGIHMEFSNTPMYNSAYIEGIHNLYEFDCGELSGWMYKVNEWFPNYGCSRYPLHDGDIICWEYTCDQGADIGGFNAMGS